MSTAFILRRVTVDIVDYMYEPGSGMCSYSMPRSRMNLSTEHNLSINTILKNDLIKCIKNRSGDSERILVNKIRRDTPCYWCKVPFDKFPYGFKFNRPIDLIFEPDKVRSIGTGSFCSLGCAYSYSKWFSEDRNDSRTPMVSKSIDLIKKLHFFLFPDKDFVCANDWRLLDINGGPLTLEQFRSNEVYFEPTHSLYCEDVYIQYRLSIKQ